MVDVRVGEPDLAECESPSLDFGQQRVQVAARINDGGLPGGVAPDNGAVLLERRDGER